MKERVESASGRYGLIARSKDFTLVPLRTMPDRSAGTTVSGIMQTSIR
ncbi:MAG: DUF3363 domain-containing protein [Pseudomonadota bacterium]